MNRNKGTRDLEELLESDDDLPDNIRRRMKISYLPLNNVQTQIITWGNPFECCGSDVIICITGNPGIPDFYTEFGTELHRKTGLPLCVIGQAGHVEVPDIKSNILDKQYDLFNLQGQLAHKLDLLNNHIDKKSRLHLIGHSIGAWMIVELLHNNEHLNNRISTINLLFPTVQKMATSENGIFLNGIVRRINTLVILLLTLVHLLPEFIKSFFVSLYMKFKSLPGHYKERILKFLSPKVGEKVLFLAYDEMDKVVDLNKSSFNKIKHKTNVIYSSRDGWAPVKYMDDLKIYQPSLTMKEVDIDHAFILKHSERVAEMVFDFIKTAQNK